MNDISGIGEIDDVLFEPEDVDSSDGTIESELESEFDNELNEYEESIAIFSTKTRVQEVYYSTVPIEYPKTSELGVATVYNITGWTNPRDCWKNIQYSLGGGGQSLITSSPFFGNISVKKEHRTCMGIKYCEFVDPKIINQGHNEVDFDSEFWQEFRNNEHTETKKSKTYALYLRSVEYKCQSRQNGVQCSGKPKLITVKNYQASVYDYIIGCDMYQPNDKYHRTIKVDPMTYDISLLRDLLSGNVTEEERSILKHCARISSRSSKAKLCGKPHINADGHIVRGNINEKRCGVKLTLLTPYDLQQCPCIVIICKGIHNHPPPPPERIPKDDLQTLLINAIKQDNFVTAGAITSGNLLKANFRANTLSDIQASINNIDRLRYLVGKTYKNIYPFGQGILGVIHYVQTKQLELNHYVHTMSIYPNELVIFVCMLRGQAELIHKLDSIQFDLTFKRIKGDINEFEINSYNPKHNLFLSYARVYTNVTTAEGYQRVFADLFNVIKNLTGQMVKFRHIDGEGIGCIMGDLDAAQAKGLGLFLHGKNSLMDWETHLTYIFKSSIVHFKRNAHAERFSPQVLNLILNIPIASSLEELEKIFYMLEQSGESNIKGWINYYRQPYVLASLNLNASKINSEIWASSINNPIAAEAAANQEGKQIKLLTAIIRGRQIDERTLKVVESENIFGIPCSWNDNGEIKGNVGAINYKGTPKDKNKRSLDYLVNY